MRSSSKRGRFWNYPHGVLTDWEDTQGIRHVFKAAKICGKAGWDRQHWYGSMVHFRFTDLDEAIIFAVITEGELL